MGWTEAVVRRNRLSFYGSFDVEYVSADLTAIEVGGGQEETPIELQANKREERKAPREAQLEKT